MAIKLSDVTAPDGQLRPLVSTAIKEDNRFKSVTGKLAGLRVTVFLDTAEGTCPKCGASDYRQTIEQYGRCKKCASAILKYDLETLHDIALSVLSSMDAPVDWEFDDALLAEGDIEMAREDEAEARAYELHG